MYMRGIGGRRGHRLLLVLVLSNFKSCLDLFLKKTCFHALSSLRPFCYFIFCFILVYIFFVLVIFFLYLCIFLVLVNLFGTCKLLFLLAYFSVKKIMKLKDDSRSKKGKSSDQVHTCFTDVTLYIR
jgi:hypothetical protein